MVLFKGLVAVGSEAVEPIRSISEIRELTAERAAEEIPIRLTAQILWKHPLHPGMILHGDGVGIYAIYPYGDWILEQLDIGDVVRVEGTTAQGFFSPDIVLSKMEKVGSEPLPEARPFYSHEIYFTDNDCDWVWLAGRIESMAIFREGDRGNIMLDVENNNVMLQVQVPWSAEAEEKTKELLFNRVRFNAVAGTKYNMNRQIVGRIFFVGSVDDFHVVDNYKPSVGVEEIHELLRIGDNPRFPARTRGLVTHVEDGHVYLRGSKACIRVKVRDRPDVVPGDYVELEGFILPRSISPEFAARDIHVIEHRAPPEPVELEPNQELRLRWKSDPYVELNQELVRVNAQVVDINEWFSLLSRQWERTLRCRQGDFMFEARLPVGVEMPRNVRPGAKLQLTGICNLTRDESGQSRLYVDWFWIEPRSEADIVVTSAATWWTTTRLLWMLGILLGLSVLSLVWVTALHRTVEKQTGIIARQVERESIMEERHRIARELHDSLEQGLAGMAIQLRGCIRLLELNLRRTLDSIASAVVLAKPDHPALETRLERLAEDVGHDSKKNQEAIEVVQAMLTYCSEESRNSIMDLRGGPLERMDLAAAVRQAVEMLALECDVKAEVVLGGTPRRFKQEAERNLLMVVREAMANAVRHANPRTIRVELNYSRDFFSIFIEDDGGGFSLDEVPVAGRFGLQGMQERVGKLDGRIKIESELGKGTRIRIEIPSTRKWEIT